VAFEFLSGPNAILSSEIRPTAKEDAEETLIYATVKLIGTGPYKITKAVPCDSMIMEINKDHMEGTLKGKLLIGKLVFGTIGDTKTQMVELLTGGVDWTSGIRNDKSPRLKKHGCGSRCECAYNANKLYCDGPGGPGQGITAQK
jgi:peptide/nickel transport system substrate-binding protein